MTDASRNQAEQDFHRAKARATLSRLAELLTAKRNALLPFEEAKLLIRPESESYAGLVTVPLERIVGSEGRYKDFNSKFLPLKEHLRKRWVSVDSTRYDDIILPPIRLYEMGGVYFVRDGNHRVSVAKSTGQLYIDAEVVSLRSKIDLEPGFGIEEIKSAVIAYERREFLAKTSYRDIVGVDDLSFTETGRYDMVIEHILVHKYFLNQSRKNEIPFSEALASWHQRVYTAVVEALREERLLDLFPGRTESDLYMFLVRRWDDLKHSLGSDVKPGEAARRVKSERVADGTGFLAWLFRILGGEKKK